MEYEPTNKLRFVERPEPVPGHTGMVSTVRKVRILQQRWEQTVCGLDGERWTEGEWRDVPLEPES